MWQGRFEFSQSSSRPQTGQSQFTIRFLDFTPPDQPANPWNFHCFEQARKVATCALLKGEIHSTIEEYFRNFQNAYRVHIVPVNSEEMPAFIEMFTAPVSNVTGPNMGLILCDLKNTRNGPNLARCLVARYEPQLNRVVATIPPDQIKFLADVQASMRQQQ
uniref:Retrotrans_gag domain-containing protein n=2 Tax=Macrostomum lignano TaxID=282301 RepID=A0A1I8I9B8_9PLAT